MVGSINRMQWDIDHDFTVTSQKIWLSDSGRRKAIAKSCQKDGSLRESHSVQCVSMSIGSRDDGETSLRTKQNHGVGRRLARYSVDAERR